MTVTASVAALAVLAPALAQQPPTPEELKKKQQQQQGAPQRPQQPPAGQRPPPQQPNAARPAQPPPQVRPAPAPVQPTPPPKAATQPPPRQPGFIPQRPSVPPPAPLKANTPPAAQPKTANPLPPSSVPPVQPRIITAPPAAPRGPAVTSPAPGATAPQPKTAVPATPPPAVPSRQPGLIPPAPPKSATPVVPPPTPPPGAPAAPRAALPGAPPNIGNPVAGKIVAAPTGATTFAQVQAARVVKTDGAGRQVTTEPGNRTIIKQNNTVIVHRNETTVINNFYPSARSVPRPNGITETFYVRPDGVRIFSETDRNGRLVRRYGRPPSGPEIVYVDNRKFYRNLAIGVGIGVVALAIAAPVIAMPRERYIVDYERATDDDLYVTLVAPPVSRLQRTYSLEEVRYSQPLRDHMPRVDLDAVTFETGSFVVSEDQYTKLDRIARAMAKAIQRNPGEMFLIEGHTDAVGSSEDNASLSDRRAEAIQRVLVEYYQIPMENLTTQGYGEQYLKVPTQGPERANRRVAVRRITPLLGGNEG